ncbi:MAG: ABC transporter ATP-binding protein [Syntrophorhabdales bacterium]|jgi:branched-chain amino acid transport system ATP-binding protein
MLRIKDAEIYYGRAKALKGVSLEVHEGEFVTLLGANGAGKTTLLLAISGLKKMVSGTVEFLGTRIDNLRPDQIVSLGIAHVPQGRQLFPDMTVSENLELGAYKIKDRREKKNELDRVLGYFKMLAGRKNAKANTLSGGMQQMLAVARGLMLRPKLLLLDEPSLGLAPVVVEELARLFSDLNNSGMAILLVEQNAMLALEIADRAYVLENGSITASDRADELMQSELIRKAYLGL